jgi:predicted CXXCH cytochrome family protein
MSLPLVGFSRTGTFAEAVFVRFLLTAVLSITMASQTTPPGAEPGSQACSGCHAAIYQSYMRTDMATASGMARDALVTAEFTHQKSGVRYRVYQQANHAWLSYERAAEPGFHGKRELLYFIGSGRKGRSYLFSVQDFLFESPINWYAQEGRWNMAPAYTDAEEIPMNLPSLVDCLNCHVSGLQPPVAGTENQFPGEPFQHGGITCERCHGLGEGHLQGRGMIVNPAQLSPERRDSVCMECHFEGTVAVKQPNRSLYKFQPGDRLSDYVHYFVLSGDETETGEALSQFEALSMSACKRKSGDRMSCLSCHDPHNEPNPAQKAAYYRGKCLECHGEKFAANHHPEQRDCTQCHMPSLPSKDVAHTQATDHRILRYPAGSKLQGFSTGIRLEPFPDSEASQTTTRDLALAWETLAQRNNTELASKEAEDYLRKAVRERPEDPVLLSGLGFVEQEHGRDNQARDLYERTLKLDPLANDAASNLGVLEAKSGHLQRALELWQGAFGRMPYQSAIGMNLATVLCAMGDSAGARRYVAQVLEFNPDFAGAKHFATELKASPPRCKP